MARVHLAVAALLVLAGCTGGGIPSTASETTGETEAPMGTTTTDRAAETTAGEAETTTSPTTIAEVAAEDTNETLPEEGVFEYYGVAMNYSAGGDLDAESVARSHFLATQEAESLTASVVSRTETGNYTTTMYTAVERDANRSLVSTNGTGSNVTIYRSEGMGAMKIVDDGETNYLLLGDGNESNVESTGTDPSSSFVMMLAKLQTMPYEEVETVTPDGTTLTKYEATGPGYYADGAMGEDASVESYSSTVLVGEDGVVRLFHQKVVVEQGGETMVEETTLRHEDVGSTTVTPPEWAETVLNETAKGDGGNDG